MIIIVLVSKSIQEIFLPNEALLNFKRKHKQP